MTDQSRFWGDSDRLQLTPFVEADYVEFDMDPTGLNGVQAKAFVRDGAGDAWLLKSGAFGDARSTRARPSVIEERTRRAAFPVHEAIVARLLGTAGVCANDVEFAFRRLHPIDEPQPRRLLVSAHRLVHGRRHDKLAAFAPSADFLVDRSVAGCVNRVVGQRDDRGHNYLVSESGRFVPVDNGDCMDAHWLSAVVQPQDFAGASASGELRERLAPLTAGAVRTVFATIPSAAVAWHDEALGCGHYTAGTLAEKCERVVHNVAALRRWAGLSS